MMVDKDKNQTYSTDNNLLCYDYFRWGDFTSCDAPRFVFRHYRNKGEDNMRKTLNIAVILFVLTALAFGLAGCDGNTDQAKADEMLGTDVKLNGTWKSQTVTYTHDGKRYSGQIELRFNDDQMQIVASYGASRLHRYTRNGIALNVTDPYISEDNPYRTFPFALEFDSTGFAVDLGALTFMEGADNIKLKFTKVGDSASLKEPEEGGENPNVPANPNVSQEPTSLDAFVIEGTTLKGLTDYGQRLGSIVLPNNISSIGEEAFRFCINLNSITISDSVTVIDNHAFYGCTSLTSVTIQNSVTYIGKDAFYGCTDLTSITIPESVTYIGDHAFYECKGLTAITYTGAVEQWYELGYTFSSNLDITCRDGKAKLRIQKEISDDIKCTSVEGLTPYGKTNCTEIVIPEGVTEIGNYAFSGCSGLTSITIPASVTHIGEDAFENCTNLTAVTYTGAVEQWYELGYTFSSNPDVTCRNGMAELKIKNTVVNGLTPYGKSNCTEITIPEGVTRIKHRAFEDCTNLTSITIPSSVTEIESYAFDDCTGLTSITISDSVTSIEDYTFSGCTSLTDVTYTGTVEKWYALGYVMPSTADITCADGKAVFKIQKSTNGSTVKVSVNGLTPYGKSNCTEITIPEGVTEIGKVAFECCFDLTKITIPTSVTSIGEFAFCYCTGLTSITIPNNVTEIGYAAFGYCTGLTSVTFPASVTRIGEGAFAHCTGLTSITIPNSVTTIEDSAFSGCTSLTDVTYTGTVEQCFANGYGYAFDDVDITCKDGKAIFITSIDGTEDLSVNGLTPYGKTNYTEITIPEGVKEIGAGAFFKYTSLTSITIPDSITKIGGESFYDCTGLTSITIPEGVISIGVSAFEGCSGLTSITIPDSVTSIGNSAFYGCKGLTEITIPNGITKIEDYTFANCTGLTSITIPEGVTLIGWNYNEWDWTEGERSGAFKGCTALTEIWIPTSVTKIKDHTFEGCTNLTDIYVNQLESTLLDNADVPDGCSIHWNESV